MLHKKPPLADCGRRLNAIVDRSLSYCGYVPLIVSL